MGLFKKKISPEEANLLEQAKAENQVLLKNFNMTKALGVKKYQVSQQFIYDETGRQFVVVEGPAETFKERTPFVIGFDQVSGIRLQVDESWSKDKSEFAPKGFGNLLQEDYSKVYWRYNFILFIETTHPVAKTIEFKMNFKPTILKVKSHNFMYRRGLEIGGTYEGDKINKLFDKMTEMIEKDKVAFDRTRTWKNITGDRPDGLIEGVGDRLKDDTVEAIYLKKLENVQAHIKRAVFISNLLNKK